MKSTTFCLGDNTITFTNDWDGNESVILNNEVVSKQFSWFGTAHVFTIELNGVLETITVKSGVSFAHGIVVKLYKADVLVNTKYMGLSMGNSTTTKNTYLIIGVVYIILSLTVFSKFFLPIGIVFLVLGLTNNTEEKSCKCAVEKDIKRL
jgi:hypothetical protein